MGDGEREQEGGGAGGLGVKEPAGAAFVAPEPMPPGCTCKRMPYERLPTPPRDGCLVHGRSHEAMGVEPVMVARSLDQMGARIARVERSCVALERRAFPERLVYSPSTGTASLADRIRDGWSRGFHLVGLTVGTDPDPIWDSDPRGSASKRALIEASGKFGE